MKSWVYFASPAQASLADTVEAALNTLFIWRSAFNSHGALIAKVGSIRVGDRLILAWKETGRSPTAYLDCTVAAPTSPVRTGLVVDRLDGMSAMSLMVAGYPGTENGEVEGIHLSSVRECCFELSGDYAGPNAIHKLADDDIRQLSAEAPLPLGTLQKQSTSEDKLIRPLRPRVNPAATAFDAYIMVDWSSKSQPATGKDSIWIACAEWDSEGLIQDDPQNPTTRVSAVEVIKAKLQAWKREQKRVLVGFDFAFAYPAGFADKLNLQEPSWKALYKYFAAQVTDDERNRNNRDKFASDCNQKVGGGGPFWGCGEKAQTDWLKQKRVGRFQFPHHGLKEWRATEDEARKRAVTQSVWKLNCGVSVGGQTILGIKWLVELSEAVGAHIWPFDGWGMPSTAPATWFAEIFPSLVPPHYLEASTRSDRPKDCAQVQACVQLAAERDAAGLLATDLAKPSDLHSEPLRLVEDEEGWILWCNVDLKCSIKHTEISRLSG